MSEKPMPRDGFTGQDASQVLVALETSTRVGSVAVAVDGRVCAEVSLGVEGRQAAQLIPVLDRVMADLSLSARNLSGVIVGSGPGSFTGVRIGVATARGIAHPLDLPVWPHCSLEGAYHAALGSPAMIPPQVPTFNSDRVGAGDMNLVTDREQAPGSSSVPSSIPPLLVLFDARADRLYAAGWGGDTGSPTPFLAPTAITLGELAGLDLPPGVQACGSGAWCHREVLEDAGIQVLPAPLGEPTAAGLMLAHWAACRSGLPTPLSLAPGTVWAPNYLRPSQPERLAAIAGRTGPR
jgi:tRNA threonylcarbamoyl adenosine modification protein YeaZ